MYTQTFTYYKLLRYTDCKIHRDLKISLYVEMIQLFDKGQMWEQALEHCRELAVQYEEELVDFYAMSRLRTQEAGFYDNIMHRLRPEPEYFRVAFYGRSFPPSSRTRFLCTGVRASSGCPSSRVGSWTSFRRRS